jgi:branched-chain amino acid transport system substrate-binding protein
MAAEDFAKTSRRKVEILSGDHQNKPDIGANIARRWLDVEGVDMIADMPNSAVALAVGDIVREKNKVAIGSGAGTAALTGARCSPNFVHWTYDTWAFGHGTARGVLAQGGKTWFFITADYAFGQDLEKQASDEVTASGGKVLGAVRHPLNSSDFSSFLLQAQPTNPNVIGLANSSDDTVNSIKQAVEFGLTGNGAQFAAYVLFLEHIQAITLRAAQGLLLVNPFYWNLNDETRAWSKRFEEKIGHPPDWDPAMSYSAVFHYLKAVKAAGTRDADAVAAKMRETPVNDFTTRNGKVRVDGRVLRNLYLLQVKKPEESTSKWDIYNVVATVPGEEAFRPLDKGNCPLATSQK